MVGHHAHGHEAADALPELVRVEAADRDHAPLAAELVPAPHVALGRVVERARRRREEADQRADPVDLLAGVVREVPQLDPVERVAVEPAERDAGPLEAGASPRRTDARRSRSRRRRVPRGRSRRRRARGGGSPRRCRTPGSGRARAARPRRPPAAARRRTSPPRRAASPRACRGRSAAPRPPWRGRPRGRSRAPSRSRPSTSSGGGPRRRGRAFAVTSPVVAGLRNMRSLGLALLALAFTASPRLGRGDRARGSLLRLRRQLGRHGHRRDHRPRGARRAEPHVGEADAARHPDPGRWGAADRALPPGGVGRPLLPRHRVRRRRASTWATATTGSSRTCSGLADGGRGRRDHVHGHHRHVRAHRRAGRGPARGRRHGDRDRVVRGPHRGRDGAPERPGGRRRPR